MPILKQIWTVLRSHIAVTFYVALFFAIIHVIGFVLKVVLGSFFCFIGFAIDCVYPAYYGWEEDLRRGALRTALFCVAGNIFAVLLFWLRAIATEKSLLEIYDAFCELLDKYRHKPGKPR